MTDTGDAGTAAAPAVSATVSISAIGWPEIRPGDDLAELLSASTQLADGDIVVVTSKVVSKAEGRLTHDGRRAAARRETVRVVARRGELVIAQTRHGLVLAAAGVDASNTPPGTTLLLPLDPDVSARQLRTDLLARTGRNVAVVISDTAGRAWRSGQTDLAIGCAGLDPLLDLRGTTDSHGMVLRVTTPALADEIAAAGDLVKGKATGRPVALVRGLAVHVLPAGLHGPGARALVREPESDLFALGARDAVAVAAERLDSGALARFPPLHEDDPDPLVDLVARWRDALPPSAHERIRATLVVAGIHPERAWTLRVEATPDADPTELLAAGRIVERAATVAAGWGLREATCPQDSAPPWRLLAGLAWSQG